MRKENKKSMVKIVKSKENKNTKLVFDNNQTFEKIIENRVVKTEFDNASCSYLGYDNNNYPIHCKDLYWYECWSENNSDGFCIHFKNSDGFEYWKEYDKNNNLIHYKNSNEFEYYYNSDNNIITKEEYNKLYNK